MSNLGKINRGLKTALSDKSVQGILLITIAIIFWASVFYHFVEGWAWVDSVYFSVVTISTVGFGDFSPETSIGKIFTIFYIIIGLGVFVTAATTIADAIISQAKKEDENSEKEDG
ncbi:MAG: potassium channel family protein [Pseudoruegeria sp.]